MGQMKIRYAWCKETSYFPDEWTPENPALGQCAVTALVLQDIVGGEIIKCLVGGQSHYFLRVAGQDIDLTYQQWMNPDGSLPMMDYEIGPVSRNVLLDNYSTRERYYILRERVGQ